MLTPLLFLIQRHGKALMASGLLVGFAFPALAAILRAILPIFIFALTASTFLTIDWPAVLAHARRLGPMLLIPLWIIIIVPVALSLIAKLAQLPASLIQGVILWATSPPLASSAAFAALLGLDEALALLAMVCASFLVPFILPPLTLGLMGIDLGLGILPLMTRLALFIGGAALCAVVLRRIIGTAWLQQRSTEFSAFNVLLLYLFAIAIMDGIRERILAEPGFVLLYVATAFLANLLIQATTFSAFFWIGRKPALTVAMAAGNRNMGAVFATLGSAATPEIALFFVVVQFPIYVLPACLGPIYRRLMMPALKAPSR